MQLDYQKLFNNAMFSMMQKILEHVKKHGIDSEHGLYFTFRTDHPGVKISKSLKVQYPRKITIILQYQYHNLTVTQKYFSVTLSFDGVAETIKVPFDSLTNFSDPAMNFSFEFDQIGFDQPELIENSALFAILEDHVTHSVVTDEHAEFDELDHDIEINKGNERDGHNDGDNIVSLAEFKAQKDNPRK